jgi:dihydroorotate dehydrogenase
MRTEITSGSKQSCDLSIELAGVRLPTPVGVGSIGFPCGKPDQLTLDRYCDIFLKHLQAGAGFICLPHSIHVSESLLEDLEKKVKPSLVTRKSRRPIMFARAEGTNSSLYCVPPVHGATRVAAGSFLRDHKKLIAALRERKPRDIPIIANVSGLGFFPESFVSGAKAHEQAGVDLIELNLSTPGSAQSALYECLDGYFRNDFPLRSPGLFLGDQPDLAEEVVREVVKAVNIPVGIKISPETGFPRVIDLARRVKRAGAAFINCGNFALAVAAPDIYHKGRSKLPYLDGNFFMAMGGDLIRSMAYKQVAAIGKFVPGIDIVACGGISTPEHMVEVMMLGAKAVQIVTPLLYQGRKLILADVRFLERYMMNRGIALSRTSSVWPWSISNPPMRLPQHMTRNRWSPVLTTQNAKDVVFVPTASA